MKVLCMTMDLRNYEGEELVSTFLFVKIFALQNSHEKKNYMH